MKSMNKGQYSCHTNYCKAYRPGARVNPGVRSGDKSNVSRVGYCEKHLQAKLGMVKIMNLNHTHPVRPYTVAPYLLTRNVSHGKLPESKAFLMTMGARNVTQTSYMGQGPKPRIDDHNGTSGLPKADPARGASYGNGSDIVKGKTFEGRKEIQHKNEVLITKLGEELSNLYKNNINNPERVNYGVIHVISSLATLIVAYETLKSKPGNMTPGIGKQTLDGTALRTLELLSRKLKAGKFKFSPARRIYLPKPGKTEKRPLTIPSPREKIVQKAVQLVLEGAYEPSFLPYSHGFRPGRGTHTALRMIDQQCKNANWFIEADISKCFDTIDHTVLMGIISERISCDKTKALIRSALEAGHMAPDTGLAVRADMGTPQGSVLSPILCNIYMHKLDQYLERLMQKYNRGKRKRQNPPYTKLLNTLAKTTSTLERIAIRAQMRKIPARDPMDPNMIRVKYVRYADDFIISVTGPHSLAKLIKSEVEGFLKTTLQLNMNHAKSIIINTKIKPAKFLGTRVRTGKSTEIEKPVALNRAGKRTRLTPRISLHAPIDEIYQKLKTQGFIKSSAKHSWATPTSVGRLTNMDHADIISYYNNVGRGILNYYSFADNRKSLGSVIRALHMSCARTLALKYKLRFAAKVFKKFGKHLKDPDSNVRFYFPETYKRTRNFQTRVPLALKTLEKSWANKLTKSNLNRSCVICGAMPAEMHHVKRIKELKSRKHLDWFTMQMAAINRKQVPLCKDHHKKLHSATLSEMERTAFAEGCKEFNTNVTLA
jgi:group II intron reverse transcriptase/maturase